MARKAQSELRHGYTTGTCAAAAAKAAAIALIRHRETKKVEIGLPGGDTVSFKINRCLLKEDRAECSVIKDAGDDPDSTDGAEIQASVSIKETSGISISGGVGVGTVTKPGLEIPVGKAAINPVPLRMIEQAVREVIQDKGADVIISVPEGGKLARKTLNSRLGIVGGISIIGTTGIVIPYSIDAYTASISQAMDIALASGCRTIVVTTGRRSEKYAQGVFQLPEESFIQAGDFIGHSLEEFAKRDFDIVVLWGMTGKMSKLAAGHFYTNISDSRVDIGFLVDIAAGCGVPRGELDGLGKSVTANHLRRSLAPEHSACFCSALCRLAAERCRELSGSNRKVTCILSDYDGEILGRSDV